MPSRMKTTRCFFLIIVVLSSCVILMSLKWKVTKNVYKLSSEISQVKISGVFYSNLKFQDATEDTNSAGNVSDIILSKAFNQDFSRQELENLYDSINNDIGISSKYTSVTPEPPANNLLANENKAPRRNYSKKSELPSEEYGYYAETSKTNFQIFKYSRNLTDSLTAVNNSETSTKLINFGSNEKELKSSFEKLEKTEDHWTKIPSIKQYSQGSFNDEKLNKIMRRIERIKSQLVNKQGRIVKGLIERSTDVGVESKRLRNTSKKKGLVKKKVFTINEIPNIRGNVVIADLTEVSPRPDNCKECFKSNFQNIINEPDLCKGDVDILILITSSFKNIAARNAIRSTWCKICNNEMSKIKYLFVFGSRNNMTENLQLLEESKTYKDIIQIDFYDSYANLTYKTISALQWSKDHCQKAKFVMKTDDDMYVNTELLQHLLKVAPTNKLIGGKCWGPSSPFRNSNSKWYVSLKQYRHPYFPSMCSGTGYIMSNDVVTGILRQSPNVPFFHLEDVYVAICVQRLGIRPKLINGFNNNFFDFDACIYRNKLFTSHGFNAVLLKYVWQQTQTCPIEPVRPLELYSAVTV